MMKIAVLPGDGIGKEVTAQALRALKAVVGGEAEFTEGLIGGAGVQAAGTPLPPETPGAGTGIGRHPVRRGRSGGR